MASNPQLWNKIEKIMSYCDDPSKCDHPSHKLAIEEPQKKKESWLLHFFKASTLRKWERIQRP